MGTGHKAEQGTHVQTQEVRGPKLSQRTCESQTGLRASPPTAAAPPAPHGPPAMRQSLKPSADADRPHDQRLHDWSHRRSHNNNDSRSHGSALQGRLIAHRGRSAPGAPHAGSGRAVRRRPEGPAEGGDAQGVTQGRARAWMMKKGRCSGVGPPSAGAPAAAASAGACQLRATSPCSDRCCASSSCERGASRPTVTAEPGVGGRSCSCSRTAAETAGPVQETPAPRSIMWGAHGAHAAVADT